MSYLIDEVARNLANPTPRRKAFRLIGGLLAGAFFATRQEARAQGDGGGVGPCKPACGAGTCCCASTKQCLSSTGANGGTTCLGKNQGGTNGC